MKLVYTAFVAVLVPVYWTNYGPTNFLYFCDVALFLALGAVWMENALLGSAAAVGIVLPQMLWVADFGAQLAGFKITGLTDYMFDASLPLFLRGLSLFHGWLPFFLLFLVVRLGYDKRGFWTWVGMAWALMAVSYFFLPKPGDALENPHAPVNINYVFGIGDKTTQTWMPAWAWFALMMAGLPALLWLPSHWAFSKWFRQAGER